VRYIISENTDFMIGIKKEAQTSSNDVKYIKIENTTYEVVSDYVGKQSLLDIVKSAIRRDIESGNY